MNMFWLLWDGGLLFEKWQIAKDIFCLVMDGGYILAGGEWWWTYFGRWWVVVDVGGWWWMVVGRSIVQSNSFHNYSM